MYSIPYNVHDDIYHIISFDCMGMVFSVPMLLKFVNRIKKYRLDTWRKMFLKKWFNKLIWYPSLFLEKEETYMQ